MDLRAVVFGGGVFDTSGEHPNKKGWDIFELGQRSFWAVPTAIAWDEPVREDPTLAEPIAAMLSFLCPGEKAAVTGASYISNLVRTEEAKFYFAEQALEEAKHYDALRRVIPKINGRPMAQPGPWLRLLYSFGVVERDDVAFMMGNINVIGEHLAHQILHRINHVTRDPELKKLIGLIGRDESRHIAAGLRFFPEVFHEYRARRHRILAKNLVAALILTLAGAEMVGPMTVLKIDLAEILDGMFEHFIEVSGGFASFPERALLEAMMAMLRKNSALAVRSIRSFTDENGEFEVERLIAAAERAVRSPRGLRDFLAA